MPVPATLTSYLPVLLSSVTNTVPDDSACETQPEGQVDYLSHNWREEDVWRSWRSMTRQKNAIANGMRLENASWRTWWKQRNKLKTISPETLNWLKDSDVTWLYGPLHVGTDWQQMAHHEASQPHHLHEHPAGTSRPVTPLGKKPILKHRSISELLSLPASPLFHNDSEEEEDASHHGDTSEHQSRPPLLHTKSDTHLSWRSRPFRKDSPPRIIASDHQTDTDHLRAPASSSSSNSAGSDQDLSASPGAEGSGNGKKKHISFNTFVEQYIAIEKPKPKRRASSTHFVPIDEGYDEDSELGDDDDESDEPSSYYMNKSGGMDSDSEDGDNDDDDDDDDGEVLEMRSSRSNSSSSSRRSALRTRSPATAMSTRRPALTRQASTDRERVTIAPIPPAMLKTTGVGNSMGSVSEDRSSQKEVELVYAPPTHSIYSHPNTPSVHHEDVYHHRESYFSVGTGPAVSHSRSADSSPVMNTFSLPPAPRDPARQISHSQDLSQFFVQQQPVYESPMHADDVREEDAYDYFGGPDLGEDYHHQRPSTLRSRRSLPDRSDRAAYRELVVAGVVESKDSGERSGGCDGGEGRVVDREQRVAV
ncbi:hypothetical protein NM688_g8373 [Phlebia brevispora]|uniref:Uncharacterized protein n=1 Tax=Phlebia brevispora TaxID=194682 RepID=A0ACC1RUS7_9APHY|nr:hypothetical protein NM688_g8373 [Phlebia brevispora]